MRSRTSKIVASVICTSLVISGASRCKSADGEAQVAAIKADGAEVAAEVLNVQQQRIDAMRKAAAATVAIFGLEGDGGGSGVLVTPDGYALTNYHVSSACGDHMRCGLNDGQVYDAVIVGVDATGDVSLIKLLGRDDFPTAPLADSDNVRVGQWVFAAGNPFVLATNLQPTVTLGIVSGVKRYQYPAGTLLEYADCIQTDAAINPGNSGGPLFNFASEVVGINGRCSFEKRGRVNVGVGYAISANQIKHFMGMLRSGRLVDHATLGATVSTDDSGKILISNILSSSDAYRRGVRYGDEIVMFADRTIETTNDFKNVLGTLPRDWRVPLTYRRNGTTLSTLVRLAGVHTEQQLINLVDAELGKDVLIRTKGQNQKMHQSLVMTANHSMAKIAAERSLQRMLRKTTHRVTLRILPRGALNKKLVKSMLKARAGFANYYFNELNRDAVWQRAAKLGDFSKLEPRWTLTGKVAGETTELKIELDSKSGTITVGSRSIEVPFENAMSDTISKRREGGLVVALRAWQQLLQVGPKQIGETIYLGTAPVYLTQSTTLAEQPCMDFLQSAWYDTQTRFAFPQDEGTISCIEVFGDSNEDPVEVYFDEYHEVDGRQWPGRARLQYGTEPTLMIQIDSIAFAPESKKS